MTPSEKFAQTVSDSAMSGRFDRDELVSDACALTRSLRDNGSTPEGTLKSVKQILRDAKVSPPDKLQEEIVRNCIETFFKS